MNNEVLRGVAHLIARMPDRRPAIILAIESEDREFAETCWGYALAWSTLEHFSHTPGCEEFADDYRRVILKLEKWFSERLSEITSQMQGQKRKYRQRLARGKTIVM